MSSDYSGMLSGIIGGGSGPSFQETAATQGLMEFGAAATQKMWEKKALSHARRWSEHMANTQYQRAVKDLEMAGLNPVLAVRGMSPSTGGALMLAGAPRITAPDLSKAVSSSRALKRLAGELGILDSEGNIKRSQEQTAENETSRVRAQTDLLDEQRELVEAQKAQANAATQNLEAQSAKTATESVGVGINNALEASKLERAKTGEAFDKTLVGKGLLATDRVIRALTGRSESAAGK